MTSATALSRWAARRRVKSSLRICSGCIPCAARARRPRSRRVSIWSWTSDSGTGKVKLLSHRGEEVVLGFGLDAAALAGFKVIANALLEIGVALVVAEFLGEVVVELGKNALLDGLDFDIVGDGFAGELGSRSSRLDR